MLKCMVEKDFQIKFSKWIKYHLKESCAFELKLTKENSLQFSRLEEHQEISLLAAKNNQLCFKPPDTGYQNPCDMMCIKNGGGYVVVQFYKKGNKEFFMIDIDVWIKEREMSDRKSITEDRARDIGIVCELA